MTTPVASKKAASRMGRRLGLWSLLMLPAFALWTIAFIVVSGFLFEPASSGVGPFGESIEGVEWLGWSALTAVWVLPLILGVILGVFGAVRDKDRLGIAGWIANAVVLVWLVGTSLAGWLVG